MSAQNDTAFLRMFLMILGALVAFTVIILIAARQITGSVEQERGEDPRVRAAIAERIKPVGEVNVASAEAAPAAPKSGAEVVATACNSCHGTGVLGAPKVGDKAAWSQRLTAQGGLDGLTASAIAGKGAMPPKGGAVISDAEVRAAIEHMLGESGVDVAAGAEPAGETTASAAAAPAEAVQEVVGAVVDSAKSMAAAAVSGGAAEAPAEPADVSAADLGKGKSVYGTACFACHGTGAAGAPKLGDKAAWAPRIAQGMEMLYSSSINGKGAMPPKGGRLDLSDADVKAAVAYMVNEAK